MPHSVHMEEWYMSDVSNDTKTVSVTLAAAKTEVAPLQSVSIP